MLYICQKLNEQHIRKCACNRGVYSCGRVIMECSTQHVNTWLREKYCHDFFQAQNLFCSSSLLFFIITVIIILEEIVPWLLLAKGNWCFAFFSKKLYYYAVLFVNYLIRCYITLHARIHVHTRTYTDTHDKWSQADEQNYQNIFSEHEFLKTATKSTTTTSKLQTKSCVGKNVYAFMFLFLQWLRIFPWTQSAKNYHRHIIIVIIIVVVPDSSSQSREGAQRDRSCQMSKRHASHKWSEFFIK